MDKIKEAFSKVRKDIERLKEEMNEINYKLDLFLGVFEEKKKQETSTQSSFNSTQNFDNSTDNTLFKPLKGQNMGISTGNQGVSTDRQTDRQTDKRAPFNESEEIFEEEFNLEENSIKKATDLLDSLDNIKKEIRKKFKKLTNQEMLVFSTIYQIEEEKGNVTYSDLSIKLNLSQSSIRDYVQRIIKKGIPVEKSKIKNKNVVLSISSNLKKITQLSTILQLRDL
jgi:DNA-binding MarR family transcriptional regulator